MRLDIARDRQSDPETVSRVPLSPDGAGTPSGRTGTPRRVPSTADRGAGAPGRTSEAARRLPRVAYLFDVLDRPAPKKRAAGGVREAARRRAEAWLLSRLFLPPRGRATLSAVERRLFDFAFTGADKVTRRNVQHALWIAARALPKERDLTAALYVFRGLVEHTRVKEWQLVVAFWIGLRGRDLALADACLQCLSALAAHRRAPLAASAVTRLARGINAVLRHLRHADLRDERNLRRLETFLFDYVEGSPALFSLPALAPALIVLARACRNAGHGDTARRILVSVAQHGVATLVERGELSQWVLSIAPQLSDLEPSTVQRVCDQLAGWLRGREARAGAPWPKTDFIQVMQALLGAGFLSETAALGAALYARAPDDPEIVLLCASLEKWCGRLERSRELCEAALALPGCDPVAHLELGEVCDWLGDDAAALEAFARAPTPDGNQALFDRHSRYLTLPAGVLFRQGRLADGWRIFQRKDRLELEAPPGTRIWEGEPLRSESLLLLEKKGIGDEIRYASCYGDLLQRAHEVAILCDPRLAPLLERSFPAARFVPAARNIGNEWKGWKRRARKRMLKFDLYCLAMQFDYMAMAGDLPLFLRRDRAAFPRHRGYLVSDPSRRAGWRSRLAALGSGPKVGIAWRSENQHYMRDQYYVKLDELLPVLQVQGVQFVNLQYDDCEAELEWLERTHGIPVHRWSDADLKNDLEGVAALMAELDLVVAPNTMVKELAGAVGARTLFMVPTGQAWVRWRADAASGEDVWHPSLTHVQSARAGDTAEVVRHTRERLEAFVETCGSHGAAPAGPGRHEAPPVATVVSEADRELVNVHGERYRPAPAAAFQDRKARDAVWSSREAEFMAACERLFDGAAQPAAPAGVLLIDSVGSRRQEALTVFGAHAALRQGWAVACLNASAGFTAGPSPDPDVAYFQGLLVDGASRRLKQHRERNPGLHFDWEIDWENRVCRAEGMNFYGVLANLLGKEFKRYAVDVSTPKVRERFRVLLQTCDAALGVCLEAEERLAGQGLPVRVTGFEPNYPPTGVYKVYCADRGHEHGIEFVEIRQGYEKYFRAGRSGFVGAIEAQNVTRHRLYSAAGLRADQFEAWLDEHGQDPAVRSRAEGWVQQDRSGRGTPSAEGEIVLERVRRQKARGGRVACLYGCIPFDFGHPWLDEGPAHRDLRDWYNHTVTVLNDSDTLLLVKPHPSESDFEQFGRPDKFFSEMLDVAAAHNISLLGHHWLNNADLIPYLDFGIVWRGSIATELALMGVPVVACAPYSITDHVLDFPMPVDRADYEDLLRRPGRVTLSPELRARAALVFEFYRSEVMIEYPFGWIAAKRREAGPPVLSRAELAAYLASGHPSVDRICRTIVE